VRRRPVLYLNINSWRYDAVVSDWKFLSCNWGSCAALCAVTVGTNSMTTCLCGTYFCTRDVLLRIWKFRICIFLRNARTWGGRNQHRCRPEVFRVGHMSPRETAPSSCGRRGNEGKLGGHSNFWVGYRSFAICVKYVKSKLNERFPYPLHIPQHVSLLVSSSSLSKVEECDKCYRKETNRDGA
jgi:hypothetical protein